MADVQNEVNNEVARDLPLAVRFLFWSILAIVAVSIFGFAVHSLVAGAR